MCFEHAHCYFQPCPCSHICLPQNGRDDPLKNSPESISPQVKASPRFPSSSGKGSRLGVTCSTNRYLEPPSGHSQSRDLQGTTGDKRGPQGIGKEGFTSDPHLLPCLSLNFNLLIRVLLLSREVLVCGWENSLKCAQA